MNKKYLEELLDKKYVKKSVPKIHSSAYAARYTTILKKFIKEVISGFNSLAYSIFVEKKLDTKNMVQDNNHNNIDFTPKDLLKPINTRKSNPKKPWDIVKALTGVIMNKNEYLHDYSISLSALFQHYSAKAELLAKRWTDEELSNLYRYIYGSYKKEFPNISISGEYHNNIMQAIISENLALIKSIPENILKDIQVSLSQSIISGNSKELIEKLNNITNINETRAKIIAHDQIQKAVESFKQVQNISLGIEYYEWITAEDERVSNGAGGHRQNNHRIFKYGSNEAIISYSAKKGFYYGKPGDRPNCRCIAVGVIPDIDEKIIKSSDGYGYKIVKKGD